MSSVFLRLSCPGESRHGATLAHLSDVLSELGRFDEAIENAQAAVRIAEAADHPFTLDRGLLRLGCAIFAREISRARSRAIASAGGDEHAEGYYREALALAGELGMRPLVAHCHLGLGKLHRRTGNRGQAQEHLTTATLTYREMDMAYWLEQAAAEIQQLR
jgi:tetratricopeptide (TPR) repeat protein